MTRLRIATIVLAAGLAAVQSADIVADQRHDDHGGASQHVTVAFGVGLNTAQPGNAVNHHVLPKQIEVKVGGVVTFAVAGFHQIFVYNPGKKVRDVIPNVDPAALFINDLTNLYYRGLVPAGGPPPGLPVTTNPSNAANRIESVAFFEPGVYLVICNIGQHFRDGMWAYIRVTGRRGGDDDD
jgi:hypothetical protein